MLDGIEIRADEHIIIVTYVAPFEPEKDVKAAQEKIAMFLSVSHGDYFRIDDLTLAEMDWNAFVLGIEVATRDVPGSMVDSRIRGILVGQDELVQLASASMAQDQYGATDTPMFQTLDEALAYVRKIA